MKITQPHENLICIYLDHISEKEEAFKYLEEKKCVEARYVPPFLVSAPEVWGQLKEVKGE